MSEWLVKDSVFKENVAMTTLGCDGPIRTSEILLIFSYNQGL